MITDGVILVFDVNNKNSFDNIALWIEQIRRRDQYQKIVLFGNKTDLEEQRQVTIEEAYDFSKKMKLAYFETSAKTKQRINEGFSYIANEIYDKYNEKNNDNIKINKDDNKHKNNNGNGCAGTKNKKYKFNT